MGRKKKDRIGERFVSKEGLGAYEFVIVEYNNCQDVWIEFQDEHKAKVHTRYEKCQIGKVKNPYHKSVCGVGCLGLMKDGSKPKTWENDEVTREYHVWRAMIKRCYDPKFLEEQPTYKDCKVCDRWLVFSNFLEDIKSIEGYELWKNNPNQGICLDKDIKSNGSKVYSLETCCFITQSENSKERIERCGHPNNIQGIKVYGINVKTEERTRVFDSLHEVERELGFNPSNIGKCLNGEHGYKTCGGYKWYKVD